MDAKKNAGHIIPVMNITTSQHGAVRKRRNSEDVETQRAILEKLKMDQQTDRAFSKNGKGKLQIPRTVCWDRFYDNAYRHVLNCGHVTITKTIVPCGSNCITLATAKHPQHGKTIVCQRCVEKALAVPFIPKKRARATSMPAKPNIIQINGRDAFFVKRNEDFDEELIREQLKKAGYPGYGEKKKPKALFELPPPPNPRKRRAIDEPAFDVHDHPTGEPLKRNGLAKRNVHVTVDIDDMEEAELVCHCRSAQDDDMVRCVACGEYYHPACVGYGELALHQKLMYEAGARKFFCNNCKEEKAEADYKHKASRKVRKVEQVQATPKTPAEFMAEIKGVRGNAKERRKGVQKKEILHGDKGKTAAPAPKKRRASAPPPPSRRFALTTNKFTRMDAAKRGGGGDDMIVDD
jgi:hypothetical protein